MNRPILSPRQRRRPVMILAAAMAAALTLTHAGVASAAQAAGSAKTPLEEEQEKLAGYFKAMADAYGLTAELQRRCEKAPKTVAELRDSIMKNGQAMEQAARTKVSLKDIAAAGFDNGMKRGRDLDCSQDSFNLAHDARRLTMMSVDDSFGRIKEMLKQAQARPKGSSAAPR
jgi:hypothetical protein